MARPNAEDTLWPILVLRADLTFFRGMAESYSFLAMPLTRCPHAPDYKGLQERDIVFVHGIMGSKGTWGVKDSLEDETPKSTPRYLRGEPSLDGTQLWLYTYDSHAVVGGNKKNPTIGEIGDQLRAELLNVFMSGASPSSKPLLFVAHSMGGLVVKRVLEKV